jgi:hypothetical protein
MASSEPKSRTEATGLRVVRKARTESLMHYVFFPGTADLLH